MRQYHSYQHNMFPEDDEMESKFTRSYRDKTNHGVNDGYGNDGMSGSVGLGFGRNDLYKEQEAQYQQYPQQQYPQQPHPQQPYPQQRHPQQPPYSQQPPFYDGPGKPQNRGRNDNAPKNPPPSHIPDRGHGHGPGVRAIDPGAIQGCLYNYVYIWLKNGQSFWLYPTHVGRKSISGYRWTHFGWAYTGYDLSLIESFYCTR